MEKFQVFDQPSKRKCQLFAVTIPGAAKQTTAFATVSARSTLSNAILLFKLFSAWERFQDDSGGCKNDEEIEYHSIWKEKRMKSCLQKYLDANF